MFVDITSAQLDSLNSFIEIGFYSGLLHALPVAFSVFAVLVVVFLFSHAVKQKGT
jgi:hypothetical protein